MVLRLVALLSILSMLCLGQNNTQMAPSPNQPADWAPSALSNVSFEPVAPGDLIQVYAARLQEITRSYRISKEGTINLPMVNKTLNVDHMTAGEIENAIMKAVKDSHLLVDPVVSVSVIEYRSRPVNVVGRVNYPVTLQAIGGMRLLDAIAKAQGLATEAGPEIIVSRPEMNGEAAYTRKIMVKELMGNPDSALNFVLQGGEEIRVPAADKIYIAGNVRTPGVYAMDQTGGLTVLQALALCQGTLTFTQREAVVYRAQAGSTVRKEIDIPLRAIMKRHSQDLPLLPNDIFYIPESTGRRLSSTVLDRIATFSSTTVAGAIIYGKF